MPVTKENSTSTTTLTPKEQAEAVLEKLDRCLKDAPDAKIDPADPQLLEDIRSLLLEAFQLYHVEKGKISPNQQSLHYQLSLSFHPDKAKSKANQTRFTLFTVKGLNQDDVFKILEDLKSKTYDVSSPLKLIFTNTKTWQAEVNSCIAELGARKKWQEQLQAYAKLENSFEKNNFFKKIPDYILLFLCEEDRKQLQAWKNNAPTKEEFNEQKKTVDEAILGLSERLQTLSPLHALRLTTFWALDNYPWGLRLLAYLPATIFVLSTRVVAGLAGVLSGGLRLLNSLGEFFIDKLSDGYLAEQSKAFYQPIYRDSLKTPFLQEVLKTAGEDNLNKIKEELENKDEVLPFKFDTLEGQKQFALIIMGMNFVTSCDQAQMAMLETENPTTFDLLETYRKAHLNTVYRHYVNNSQTTRVYEDEADKLQQLRLLFKKEKLDTTAQAKIGDAILKSQLAWPWVGVKAVLLVPVGSVLAALAKILTDVPQTGGWQKAWFFVSWPLRLLGVLTLGTVQLGLIASVRTLDSALSLLQLLLIGVEIGLNIVLNLPQWIVRTPSYVANNYRSIASNVWAAVVYPFQQAKHQPSGVLFAVSVAALSAAFSFATLGVVPLNVSLALMGAAAGTGFVLSALLQFIPLMSSGAKWGSAVVNLLATGLLVGVSLTVGAPLLAASLPWVVSASFVLQLAMLAGAGAAVALALGLIIPGVIQGIRMVLGYKTSMPDNRIGVVLESEESAEIESAAQLAEGLKQTAAAYHPPVTSAMPGVASGADQQAVQAHSDQTTDDLDLLPNLARGSFEPTLV